MPQDMKNSNGHAFMEGNFVHRHKEKISSAFYIIIPLTFFFSVRIFNIFIVIFFFLALFLYDRDAPKRAHWKAFLLLIVPVLICIYGVIIDWQQGLLAGSLNIFETFLPVLFFAILTLVYRPDFRKIQLTKVTFYVGCVLAALVCLITAFYKNATEHDRIVHNWNFVETMQFYKDYPIGTINWGFFLYKEFSQPMGFDPVYLSMYFILGIIFGISFLSLRISSFMKFGVGLGIAVLSIQIFLLNSKAGIIAFICVTALQAVPLFLTRTSAKSKKIVLTLTLATVIVIPLLFPIVLYRIKSGISVTFALIQNKDVQTLDSNRVQIWRTAASLIENNALTGYGLYGARLALMESYREQGLHYYNTHNQYLMFMLVAGVGGCLVFIMNQFTFLFIALKSRNFHYFLFLAVLFTIMLTENIFNRHKGVLFYSYFNAVFLLQCFLLANTGRFKPK